MPTKLTAATAKQFLHLDQAEILSKVHCNLRVVVYDGFPASNELLDRQFCLLQLAPTVQQGWHSPQGELQQLPRLRLHVAAVSFPSLFRFQLSNNLVNAALSDPETFGDISVAKPEVTIALYEEAPVEWNANILTWKRIRQDGCILDSDGVGQPAVLRFVGMKRRRPPYASRTS